MRMRELEQRTGVGRETIRFYIREGLLPEPDRASRNSASYRDEHVERVRAIKRLQEEHFLPLAVIRVLFERGEAEQWLHADAFPHLDRLLRARLDPDHQRYTREEVKARLGIEDAQIDEALATGAVVLDSDGRIDARNTAILAKLAELAAIGFDRAHGFCGELLKVYVELVDTMVSAELRHFLDRTAGQVGEAKATDMAERGIASVNELLGLIRTREILRRLEARRRIANDNI